MKRLWAILLALALMLALGGCQEAPAPAPSASPAPPEEPAHTLAFFGSALEPWYHTLEQAAAQWAAGAGWQFVRYDCDGAYRVQGFQVEELARTGGADLAVICAIGNQKDLDGWVKALHDGGIPAVTFSLRSGTRANRYVRCHIGLDETDLAQAAARYFRERLGTGQGVLLLPDSGTDSREEPLYDAFQEAGVAVLDRGHTWGGEDYAQSYVDAALERFPAAGGLVCFSRTGTQGALRAMEERGEPEALELLSLSCTAALLADLERGETGAVLGFSAREAAGLLDRALDQVSQGKAPGVLPLQVEVITRENRESLDLGY